MTPLHYCCRLPYFRLVTVDFVMEMLLLLLQHGADPNLVGRNSVEPMFNHFEAYYVERVPRQV